MKNEVCLMTNSLDEIFKTANLKIPEYQRIYCWKEDNVYQLLQDILSKKLEKEYHLGTVIFHKNNGVVNIVDGQQRLITLALILKELGQDDSENPLLKEILFSGEAEKYVAYNKYLINNYVDKILNSNDKLSFLEKIKKYLQFAVLEITGNSLDLAYTFFSNQNSNGKPLSDYNLLKAHHLRFVHVEKQAIHLAARWDVLTKDSRQENNIDINLERTLGMCLFRLRKWMRKQNWNENSNYRVKLEFEKALTIDEVPPFGERFNFYEKIQGGAHFFAYSEFFVQHYKTFRETRQVRALYDNLRGEFHWRYEECIETFLFAYYLKFGMMYLTEALICIEQLISQHRYSVSRAMLYKVLEFAQSSEIIMMIDQATSPTFFLAEALDKIKRAPNKTENTRIQKKYHVCVKDMYKQINLEDISINDIKILVNAN